MSTTALQLRHADEALHESDWLIEQAHELVSPELWRGISSRTYRQIEQAHEALRRLEEALRVLDHRLPGVGRVT
jgi:hypothetical protein